MTNEELQAWQEVFPFGVELYYDGKTPDKFAKWMFDCYGLHVKKRNGSVHPFGAPVDLVATIHEAWRGEIGSYL